jgi:hypothetical protein
MDTTSYLFELVGLSPLIMHRDDVDWADHITAWRNNPTNKKLKTGSSGDDRFPGYTWIGSLHHDREHIAVPSDMLQAALRKSSAKIATGNGKETFKIRSQSGMLFEAEHQTFLVQGKQIPYHPIQAFVDKQERDFALNRQLATDYGFELHVARLPVGTSKHVRVRPRFDAWSIVGTVVVIDEIITTKILEQMLTIAGAQCGLGDGRPSAPKCPGTYGRFRVEALEEA